VPASNLIKADFSKLDCRTKTTASVLQDLWETCGGASFLFVAFAEKKRGIEMGFKKAVNLPIKNFNASPSPNIAACVHKIVFWVDSIHLPQ
jgi:hypothetical protein